MVNLFGKKKVPQPKARKRTHAYAPIGQVQTQSSPVLMKEGSSPELMEASATGGGRPQTRKVSNAVRASAQRERAQSKGLPTPSRQQRTSSKADARDSAKSDLSASSSNSRTSPRKQAQVAPPNLSKPRFSGEVEKEPEHYQPEGFSPYDSRWDKFRAQIAEGVPLEAIRSNLRLHNFDPRIAEILIKTQHTTFPTDGDGIGPTRYSKSPSPKPNSPRQQRPNLHDDPRYAPFLGQMKVGIPPEVVRGNFIAAGFDNQTFDKILELKGMKPPAQQTPVQRPSAQKVKFNHMDRKFNEFRKMLKFGIGAASVRSKMQQYGFRDETINRFMSAMGKGGPPRTQTSPDLSPRKAQRRAFPKTQTTPAFNAPPPGPMQLPPQPAYNRAQSSPGPPPAPNLAKKKSQGLPRKTKDRAYSTPGPPPPPSPVERMRNDGEEGEAMSDNVSEIVVTPPSFDKSQAGPPRPPSFNAPPPQPASNFNLSDPEWGKFKMLLKIGVDPTGIRTEFQKQGYDETTYKDFMIASGQKYEAPEATRPPEMRTVTSDPSSGPPPQPLLKTNKSTPLRKSRPKKRIVRQFAKEPEQPKQKDFRNLLKKSRKRVDSAPQAPSGNLGAPPPAPPEVVRAKSHGPPAFKRPPPQPLQKPPEQQPKDFKSMLAAKRTKLNSSPTGPPPGPAVKQPPPGPAGGPPLNPVPTAKLSIPPASPNAPPSFIPANTPPTFTSNTPPSFAPTNTPPTFAPTPPISPLHTPPEAPPISPPQAPNNVTKISPNSKLPPNPTSSFSANPPPNPTPSVSANLPPNPTPPPKPTKSGPPKFSGPPSSPSEITPSKAGPPKFSGPPCSPPENNLSKAGPPKFSGPPCSPPENTPSKAGPPIFSGPPSSPSTPSQAGPPKFSGPPTSPPDKPPVVPKSSPQTPPMFNNPNPTPSFSANPPPKPVKAIPPEFSGTPPSPADNPPTQSIKSIPPQFSGPPSSPVHKPPLIAKSPPQTPPMFNNTPPPNPSTKSPPSSPPEFSAPPPQPAKSSPPQFSGHKPPPQPTKPGPPEMKNSGASTPPTFNKPPTQPSKSMPPAFSSPAQPAKSMPPAFSPPAQPSTSMPPAFSPTTQSSKSTPPAFSPPAQPSKSVPPQFSPKSPPAKPSQSVPPQFSTKSPPTKGPPSFSKRSASGPSSQPVKSKAPAFKQKAARSGPRSRFRELPTQSRSKFDLRSRLKKRRPQNRGRGPTGGSHLPSSPRDPSGGGVIPPSPKQNFSRRPQASSTPSPRQPTKRAPGPTKPKSKKDMKALFAKKLRKAKKKPVS